MTKDEIRSFMERTIAEGQAMTLEDWEAGLEIALPVDRRNVYEGDLGMDENTARRIATALEQIALELGPRTMVPLHAHATPADVQALQTAFYSPAPAVEIVTHYEPAQCPIHLSPWRDGARGAYCPRKLGNGSWCNQHPSVMRGASGPAGLTPLP